MGNWTAEITNNPKKDFALYIELLENEKYRGRIECDNHQLVLRIYESNTFIPVDWLLEILSEFKQECQDLLNSSKT